MSRITDFSDNFNRADNTDLGANWDPLGAGSQIVGNDVRQNGTAGSDFGYELNTTSLNKNQWAQMTIALGTDANGAAGFITRYQGTAETDQDGYQVVSGFASAGHFIYRADDGVQTLIASTTGGLATTDVFRFESRESTHEAFVNDTSVLSATDSTYALATGRAGMIGYDVTNIANTQVDDFSCGHFGQPTMRRWGGVPGMRNDRVTFGGSW